MYKIRAVFISFLLTWQVGTAWAVTTQQIASRYKVIGVIAEDKENEQDPKKKGGIAVIKDTATNRTLVLKAGLPFPGQRELSVASISNRRVVVKNGMRDILLTYQGFSGFEGEIAGNSRRSQSRRDGGDQLNTPNPNEIPNAFGRTPWDGQTDRKSADPVPPPPPFPEEIDELFFQEFGEAPVPPEVFENDGFNPNNRPLSRDELLEKYDFDPDEFSNQELENMVSPPPSSPWTQ